MMKVEMRMMALNNGATLTADRFGNANSAFDFDGVDDWIEVNHNNILNINQEFSVCAHIKVSSLPPITNFNIIEKGSTANGWEYALRISNSGNIKWLLGNPSGTGEYCSVTSTTVINLNQDYFITATFSDGISSDLYMNGVFDNQSTDFFSNYQYGPGTSKLIFGARRGWAAHDDPTYLMEGSIDDIGIWNRALDSCEVKDLYNASLGNCCALNPIVSQPTDQSTTIGNNATISFTDNLTGATYQWQIDAGTGYSDLSNAGQFSGTDTQTLTISSTTMSNNNTLYRCIVTESSNCMDTTDVSTLTVIDNTSINENGPSNLTIYPNPTSDQITIDIKGYNGVVNVEVYDLQGRLLETTTNTIVSLKKHAKGIYVLKVSYGEITEEVRVVRD